MSWDVLIQDLPEGVESVADIPDDFCPSTLGPRTELIAAIRNVLPGTVFSDPAWGVLDEADYSIEFNMGNDEEVGSIMLHIRGGDAAAAAVDKLLAHLCRRALDTGTGEFFHFDGQSAEGLRRWRAYRDEVVDENLEPQRKG